MKGNAPSESLAVVLSHPIQYYAPWFRYLVCQGFTDLKVFYLWDGGATEKLDRGFGVNVKWDIPLLKGYDYEFVPNVSKQPGPSSFRGLDNPELPARLKAYNPSAILFFGYNYLTHLRLLHSRLPQQVPLLFRGDSHRLVPERGLRAGLRRQWISHVFRRFKAFLFVGQANRKYFQLHGVPERRLFFCPHAVDNERFFAQAAAAQTEAPRWKQSLGVDPAQRVVLFAGKFEAKKRPRDLVAAFVQAKLPRTTLLLVGSGELESDLRRDGAGRADIVFAPFQNQTQMPRTYAAADVLVLPSLGRGETWGLCVNEAMCLSRPVIVSDHVGCAQDLVEPGRNGLVFKAGNVDLLTAALREAFSDPARLVGWGERSREIVQNFDYAHATEGLLTALKFVHQKQIAGNP